MATTFRATLRVAAGGRIVIPSEARDRMGLAVGTELVITVEGDRAMLISAKAARDRARQRVRPYLPPGANLSGEVSRERTREASDE